jgi:hypothetical protein
VKRATNVTRGDIEDKAQPSRASDEQIGGDHYKGMTIQPAVFCEHNGLSMLESNVVKRMCRWKTKGAPLKDLTKAKHEIDLLIEIHNVEEWEDRGLGSMEKSQVEVMT